MNIFPRFPWLILIRFEMIQHRSRQASDVNAYYQHIKIIALLLFFMHVFTGPRLVIWVKELLDGRFPLFSIFDGMLVLLPIAYVFMLFRDEKLRRSDQRYAYCT